MPAQTAAVNNPANVIAANCFVFGTIPGGATDDVPFAACQEFSWKDGHAYKKLMDPTQLTPIARLISERTVTATLKYAKVRARQFNLMRGFTPTFSSVTTWKAQVATEPAQGGATIHVKSPSDGLDFDGTFYGCFFPDMDVPLATKDFAIPSLTFEADGNGTDIYMIKLPGDQTTS